MTRRSSGSKAVQQNIALEKLNARGTNGEATRQEIPEASSPRLGASSLDREQQARRRPSSMSKQRANVPILSNVQRQAHDANTRDALDNDVFAEDDEGDEEDVEDIVSSKSGSMRTRAPSTRSRASRASRSSIHTPDTSYPSTAFPSAAASVDAFAAPRAEPGGPAFQARPAEIRSTLAEILFILVCSTGQLLFGFLQGGTAGLQVVLVDLLGIEVSQTPWLQGAYFLANGLSVIVSGPLADLIAPKYLMCGAFAWQAGANLIGVFSLHNKYLFFVVRALQGLSVGVLVSSSISILGRVYKPGQRKTRVFSIMAAMAPLGFWLGVMEGGALSHAPKYIFVVNTIISSLCLACGLYAIPNVRPAMEGLGFRSYDYVGSALAVAGCALLVAGLTQGPASNWTWYMILVVLAGLALLVAFFFVERRVYRPLIPPRLWSSPGFTPMIISYFLGFGSFSAWQFFCISFWLRVQKVSPLFVGLYQTPNAIFGVLATLIVARISHLVKGHWILAASMLAFALGPVFFLPQTPTTTYWALSMPGVSIATFGPDLSFAAVSIFVTSSVSKHYQGSAGSLLVTVQNLSSAIMTSLTETIGDRISTGPSDEISLKSLHAMWWFDFAAAMTGAVITLVAVRIPKTTEKEHVQ